MENEERRQNAENAESINGTNAERMQNAENAENCLNAENAKSMESKKRKRNNLIFIIVTLVATIAISAVFFSPFGAITNTDGKEAALLDEQFHYSPSVVEDTLSKLGAEGRKRYTAYHILDYFYCLAYCLSFIAVLKPLCDVKTKAVWQCLPLIPTAADVVENSLIELATSSYPVISTQLSTVISVATTAKWVGLALCLFGFFALLIRYLLQKRQRER